MDDTCGADPVDEATGGGAALVADVVTLDVGADDVDDVVTGVVETDGLPEVWDVQAAAPSMATSSAPSAPIAERLIVMFMRASGSEGASRNRG